jgi:DNA-binding Lrp family transcriptional regulator
LAELSYELNELDYKIIELLRKNSRMTYQEMGKILGLSEGAIRRRVKKLIENKIIKQFTIKVDLGQRVRAMSMISVSPGYSTPSVTEKLSKLEGVEEVYEVTGEYDAVAIIAVRSVNELNKCIEDVRKTEGVRNTNTMIILRVVETD